MTQRKRKTVHVDGDYVPKGVKDATLVGCLPGNAVYHVAVGNEEHPGGTWRALCGAGQGNGHRTNLRDHAVYHRFRVCIHCLEDLGAEVPEL